MFKSKKFLILFSFLTFCLIGTAIVIKINSDNKTKETFNDGYDVFQNVDNIEPFLPKEEESLNPYTGEALSENQQNTFPFMCIIENLDEARPQSGLSQADVIYETMAEGGISRFLCLFYSNNIEKIGPVRSMRPYFLNLTKEYGIPFAHCGGSADALETITNDSSIPSINEMINEKYFWRDNTRVAPHNLYTSSNLMNEFIKANLDFDSKDSFFTFDEDYWTDSKLESCQELNLKLSNYYQTSYKFTQDGYTKYMKGEEGIDSNNNESLVFQNIILQLTDITPNSDGRVDITQIGSGDAYVLSNGKIKKATWSKNSNSSPTLLKDEDDKIIPLSQGKTIWHIMDSSNQIDIF